MGRPEDSRVKIPALVHFTRLGYRYLSIKKLVSGKDYDQDTNIFYGLFQKALEQINACSLDTQAFRKIVEELKNVLGNNDLGRAFFEKLQRGHEGLKLIDFANPDNNSYVVVTELPCEHDDDSFRPDITVLVNGLPLSFMEVKRQNNREGILAERDRMTRRFSNEIYRRFVNITQFTSFSNDTPYDDADLEPIQGSFYAAPAYGQMFFSRFREQRLDELAVAPLDEQVERTILKDNNLLSLLQSPESETSLDPKSPTNSFITSLYSKSRLLFFLKYGICYKTTIDKHGMTRIEKHIMRYPQFFATLAIRDRLDKGDRRGIIWHTQGSGKTALAFSNFHFLRDYFQKKKQIARFFFIVDRLDLATQASQEFMSRGVEVNLVDSKEEFIRLIGQPGDGSISGKLTATVVNIQKFSEESISKPSDYNVDVQRVYFLDEAHRSYNPTGSMLANLMASDRSAVHIALTGTPLLGNTCLSDSDTTRALARRKFNSRDVFGPYFHTYYYNQSIADGYTLRLIREEIETTYKDKLTQALRELEVAQGSLDRSALYAHPSFVKPMVEFILGNFRKGRKTMDESIGGMIVCDSSEQARQVAKELTEQKEFSYSLILHDEGTKEERRAKQADFKAGKIDLLVVYNMLLTGFDAPRLKKLYLGRMIKAHNLLQALTRVNRPYKKYHYGFVVDFVNISEQFDKTNQAYFEELKEELGSEFETYSNIFKSHDEIESELFNIRNLLFRYNTDNVVNFIKQITDMSDPQELVALRKALEDYKALHNLIHAFGFDDLTKHLGIENAFTLLDEVKRRISILTLQRNIASSEDTQSALRMALDEIDFHFRFVGQEELVLADQFKTALERARREVVDHCLDPKDPNYISLLDELKRIFSRKNIEELTTEEMKETMAELDDLKKRAATQNARDRMLADKYDGDLKFLHAHKRILEKWPSYSTSEHLLHGMLTRIKEDTDRYIENNEGVLDNAEYFSANLVPQVVKTFPSSSKTNIEQIKFFARCISHEYLTERNWI